MNSSDFCLLTDWRILHIFRVHETRPVHIDAKRLGDGQRRRASLRRARIAVYKASDGACLAEGETDMGLHGDYSGGLLHWPPRENPYYQHEAADAFDAWWAEDRLRRLGVVVDWLEGCVWNLECELRFKRAATVMAVLEKRRAEYTRLKQQLKEFGDFY